MGGRRVGGNLNGILGEKDEVLPADIVGLEGKAIEKDKAVKLHCENFEAKSMLASMLCLLCYDRLHFHMSIVCFFSFLSFSFSLRLDLSFST